VRSSTATTRCASRSPASRSSTRRIAPAIGELKINGVTEEDAGAVVRSPLRLDAVGQAHMFHKALQWGLRAKETGNPLESVTEPKVKRRGRDRRPDAGARCG
jgi:hypothetical protein